MTRNIRVLILALALIVVGQVSSAFALPHVLFQDSDKWVQHPDTIQPAGPFAWALPEMADSAAWELINGYPSGQMTQCWEKVNSDCTAPATYQLAPEFRPAGVITRGEFAAILARSTGFDERYQASGRKPPWSDVQWGWYYPYLTSLYQQSVILESDYRRNLGPEGAISRAELAAWTARAAVVYGIKVAAADLSKFIDADQIPAALRDDVAKAVSLGVIKGFTDLDGSWHLDPNGTAKRVEAAAMMVRTLKDFNLNQPSFDALESAIRQGMASYYTLGIQVAQARKKGLAQDYGQSWLAKQQTSFKQELAAHFTDTAVGYVADGRDPSRYARYGMGDNTWPWGGYSILDDLQKWGVLGNDMESWAVVSVTPAEVLDRYAKVEATLTSTKVLSNGQVVNNRMVMLFHLKRNGDRWLLSGSTKRSVEASTGR